MKGWWVKMEIDEFTGHYIDKTDEEIVKDVRDSVVDFIRRNPEGETFGAKMVRKMDDRIAERSEQNAINGKKGAEARWSRNYSEQEDALDSQVHTVAPVRGAKSSTATVRSMPLPTTEQLYDFVRAENLDEADAREWYEMTVVERAGKDRDGKPIGNWKGALKRFCTTKTANRRSA